MPLDRPHLVDRLRQALGAEAVLADDASRHFYASDIFWQPGILPEAIVLPPTQEAAALAVRIAAENGTAIVPRGGGMSYTKGYLPSAEGALVIDTRKLDRIVEVNTADLYVTVEAGCTWARLNEALEGTGLRTGYWGPLSGINATIGGALSQNSAFFGSGQHGTVAESVLGVTIALADGRVATTGSGGRIGTKPFTREGGPDLTGLFLGDNGAFGLKLAATLRLLPKSPESGHLSFGFPSMRAMAAAQAEMGRLRVIAESFGIDRTKAEHSASVNKLMDGARRLADVAKSGTSVLQGLRDAVDVATAGTAFLKVHAATLHLVVEGRNRTEIATSLDALRAIGRRFGTEIENSIPRVMRSRPFGPVRGMLGADGQRWVPIHAVFPLSLAERVVDANDAFFARHAATLERHRIVLSYLTMTVGNEFFFEPAFYWFDEITALHAVSLGEDVVRPWRDRPADPAARQAVMELRRGIQDVYADLGGVNWQVARDYPFRSRLEPATWAILAGIKQALDPHGIMNPGALGLGDDDAR